MMRRNFNRAERFSSFSALSARENMANGSFLYAMAVLPLFFTLITPSPAKDSVSQIPNEDWNYVKVRENAFMFWWLYGAQTTDPSQRLDKPLIMWLQGGPGLSSTGLGNFEELGPLTVDLKPRNTTWLRAANVLFVDNPVGTGYSYVTESSAFSTNEKGIANDLVTLFKGFLEKQPVFQQIPFYIFSQSYGGKFTSVFGVALYQAIQAETIKCNFRGVALGGSWVSPADTALAYGPYLYGLSLLDDKDLELVNQAAQATAEAAFKGEYMNSLEHCDLLDTVIANTTDNVDVFNVLRHNVPSSNIELQSPRNITGNTALGRFYARHVNRFYTGPLEELMNGPIRKKLGIIPDNVTFHDQSLGVLTYLGEDLMKPVISDVSKLLNYGLKVVLYQGQLDVTCCTLGLDKWITKLNWDGLPEFQKTTRVPLYPPSGMKDKQTGAFYKAYRNLELYYIMKAGHMVPADNGEMALEMVKRIINQDYKL